MDGNRVKREDELNRDNGKGKLWNGHVKFL